MNLPIRDVRSSEVLKEIAPGVTRVAVLRDTLITPESASLP
jgi:hypothetical protein